MRMLPRALVYSLIVPRSLKFSALTIFVSGLYRAVFHLYPQFFGFGSGPALFPVMNLVSVTRSTPQELSYVRFL